jgi:transaldolase
VILKQISDAGTSIWLDDLSRERLINTGSATSLEQLISKMSVVGVTTNPAIFSQAISNSELYREEMMELSQINSDPEFIIEELTCKDVQLACDRFSQIYDESRGVNGRVSIEVDPRSARATAETIKQARHLWEKIDRKNLLIKVPATIEGLPAIRTLISEGISVNVTIIFSTARYAQVLDAYISGLEDRVKSRLPIYNIQSVASFFISRVDSEIDRRLDLLSESHPLRGKAAIANARLAYQHFEKVSLSKRWQSLENLGAAKQRPLWASTGVKDPSYPSTLYVTELVAADTVNTMPEVTLDALYREGNFAGSTASRGYQESQRTIEDLQKLNIDIDEVAVKLEEEGIHKFIQPWNSLIEVVRSQVMP